MGKALRIEICRLSSHSFQRGGFGLKIYLSQGEVLYQLLLVPETAGSALLHGNGRLKVDRFLLSQKHMCGR